jgi:2-polyprenyl-3-methyl-5-hydroxy-6-metoxy-1,4-benzoquinol methylase
MPEWALEYFERGYAQRWGLPPVTDRIRSEISAFWGYLQLTPGAGVVDLGCGHGRHALALTEHGANVVGVDAVVALLTRARELSSDAGQAARLTPCLEVCSISATQTAFQA